jgi:hypothetical protein
MFMFIFYILYAFCNASGYFGGFTKNPGLPVRPLDRGKDRDGDPGRPGSQSQQNKNQPLPACPPD